MQRFSLKTLVATAAICAGTGAFAQASGDGFQGPVVFNDGALNESLHAMNDFLAARYVADDIFASLHTDPPGQEFVAVASAVSHVPEFRAADPRKGFGPGITGGSSLDLHLASFNEEVIGRDDPVFMRIARAAGGTSIDFAEVGAVPPVPGDALVFGPAVHDDATLNGQMFALNDLLTQHRERNLELSVAEQATTGASFDLYGKALNLF